MTRRFVRCLAAVTFLSAQSLSAQPADKSAGRQALRAPATQEAATPDSGGIADPAPSERGVPVVPFLDTVLFVQARLGSFPAAARAEAIAERIRRLGALATFDAARLTVDSTEQSLDIAYGDVILMTVTPTDARRAGEDQATLAARYADAIAATVRAHRERTSWQTLVKEVLLALLVLALLAGIIWSASRLFRRSATWLARQQGGVIRGVHIRGYELFTAERSLGAVLLINTALKWLVVLMAVYVAFPLLFSIFPWTRGLADTLVGYVLEPLSRIGRALWNYVPNLFTIGVIVWVFHAVLKLLRFLRDEISREALRLPGFYPDWAGPTYQLVRVLVYAFMLVVVFPYLPGSDSPVFKGVTVFLGALFTFGSAGSLSNVVAGLVLTYMRAFQHGDRVRIGDVTGDIIERTLLVTRLRTIKNEIISIPNSTVMASHTTNYSSDAPERGLIVHTTVTIGYDVPWRQVHQLLIEAARATDLVEAEPAPYVLQTSLDDFYVSYQINATTRQPNRQAALYSQLHQNIQDAFNNAGVEILSPHYRALRDGNATTMSTDVVPADYVPPAFRIQQT